MKKLLSLVLALLMVLGTMTTVLAEDDYSLSEYSSYGEILYAMEIIKGDSDGNLNEEATLTRAEMATIMVRLMASQASDQSDWEAKTWSDLKGHWASDNASAAFNLGLMKGLTETTFGPNSNLTYQQALMILVRAIGYDAVWEDIFTIAYDIGLTPTSEEYYGEFTRDMMFEMVCRALGCTEPSQETPWMMDVFSRYDSLDILNVILVKTSQDSMGIFGTLQEDGSGLDGYGGYEDPDSEYSDDGSADFEYVDCYYADFAALRTTNGAGTNSIVLANDDNQYVVNMSLDTAIGDYLAVYVNDIENSFEQAWYLEGMSMGTATYEGYDYNGEAATLQSFEFYLTREEEDGTTSSIVIWTAIDQTGELQDGTCSIVSADGELLADAWIDVLSSNTYN